MTWSDVLSLTSVDKREAPMRQHWINDASAVVVNRVGTAAGVEAFLLSFPRCIVKQTIVSEADLISALTTRLTVKCNCAVEHLGMALPPLLAHLVFGDDFDQRLDSIVLPLSLTHLVFGCNYNQPLDGVVLPSSLTHLTFGKAFDQSLAHVALPRSLTHLAFGFHFNQPLHGVALPALTHLWFGQRFDQALDGAVLPASLVSLSFGREFKRPLNCIAHLQHLQTFVYPACSASIGTVLRR